MDVNIHTQTHTHAFQVKSMTSMTKEIVSNSVYDDAIIRAGLSGWQILFPGS